MLSASAIAVCVAGYYVMFQMTITSSLSGYLNLLFKHEPITYV